MLVGCIEETRKEEPSVTPRVLVCAVSGGPSSGAGLEIEEDGFPCWMCPACHTGAQVDTAVVPLEVQMEGRDRCGVGHPSR